MGACGGGSGSGSSGGSGGGSGAILFLIVVVILLLFARPPCRHCPSPFRRPLCAMVGCCLLLSTALFVVARHPAIIDDCVTGRPPPAARASRCSVSPSASTFVALWSRCGCPCRRRRRPGRRCGPVDGHEAVVEETSWSSSTSGSGRHRCLDGEAWWRPDEAVRRTAHPGVGSTTPTAAGQSCCPSSSALPLPHPPRHCC